MAISEFNHILNNRAINVKRIIHSIANRAFEASFRVKILIYYQYKVRLLIITLLYDDILDCPCRTCSYRHCHL